MMVTDNILVLLFIFTSILTAQEIQNKISPTDLTKQTINYIQEKMQFKNFFAIVFRKE